MRKYHHNHQLYLEAPDQILLSFLHFLHNNQVQKVHTLASDSIPIQWVFDYQQFVTNNYF